MIVSFSITVLGSLCIVFVGNAHAEISTDNQSKSAEKVKPSPKVLITDEEEGPPKLSLPTEADRMAWRRAGFRMGLGFTYGQLTGLGEVPSGRLIGAKLRVGLRLDSDWSILSSFEYTGSGGLSGLRFAGTIDPTWHITPSLSLAVGVGFGGLLHDSGEHREDREDIENSYTHPDAKIPLRVCEGVGGAGLVRGEWGWVMGPRSQLALAAEFFGQWTQCEESTRNIIPDTGEAIVHRQYWPHLGATLTVGITWR